MEKHDGSNGSKNGAGAGGPPNGQPPGGADEPRRDEDILAFFYKDAARAFDGARQDAADLAERADRLSQFVGEVGLDVAAPARREFHRACELAERVSWLTYRWVDDVLRAGLD